MRGIKGSLNQPRRQQNQYPLNDFTMRLALLSLLVAPLLTVAAGATTNPGTYGLSKLAQRQETGCKAIGEHCCVDAQCPSCCQGTCVVTKDGSTVGECAVSVLVTNNPFVDKLRETPTICVGSSLVQTCSELLVRM
ncbi:hypothetical protein F5141DRAFT_1202428 [Pisolithus sp. B1]|nr:hypothetical protein F5141DRAFT_1202428 [Pisolithus sp. B1]